MSEEQQGLEELRRRVRASLGSVRVALGTLQQAEVELESIDTALRTAAAAAQEEQEGPEVPEGKCPECKVGEKVPIPVMGAPDRWLCSECDATGGERAPQPRKE